MSLHETLLAALRSSRTTIVFGNGGRYRDALEHALHPVWLPLGDDDGWFQFEGRDVHLLVEPEFGHVLDPHPTTLVLTSHLDLHFDPRHTRVVACHMPTRQTTSPNTREEGDAYRVPITDPHRAYLDLLTRSETTPRPWHIVTTPALRRQWRDPLARSKAACRAHGIVDAALLHHYFGFV